MDGPGVDLVTGAYGNTGRGIAERLLQDGRRVRTLTNHPDPSDTTIEAHPYAFDGGLDAAFDGVDTFYNTFWARTGGADGFDALVERSSALFDAARRAGVRRIVHLSVANPSLDSPYAYFRAKAQAEAALHTCGVPAAIVRPALIFGGATVLLDNLAWVLRRSPVFGVAAGGGFRVRPVHADDVARLCVELGGHADQVTVDAVGPERPTFRELIVQVRDAAGARCLLVPMPPRLVLAASKPIGWVMRDDLLTSDELLSTVDGLADTDGEATGQVALSDWLRANGATLGRRYRSERLSRR